MPDFAPSEQNVRMYADYPRARIPVINAVAPADNANVLSGQQAAAINPNSRAASFRTLLVKAEAGIFNISFSAVDHLVGGYLAHNTC